MNVLVINCGSSSLKFKLVEVDGMADASDDRSVHIREQGIIDHIGPSATLVLREGGRESARETCAVATHREALQWLVQTRDGVNRDRGQALQVDALGHRVVHGGERFHEPILIDDTVLATIQQLTELAPLHNPACLAGIQGARQVFGAAMPMVAVFDTGFHRAMPPRASTYAIDGDLARRHGIRRYGFHGIAHASLANAGARAVRQPVTRVRLITLQLGNGCSAAAIAQGRSVDTSMGFTPLEGLVMGTRSGDLDPALIGYVARREGLTVEEVERGLNERSGLLGLSGLSHDMRVLLKATERMQGGRVELALDVFCYRVRKYIGAYLAALGGADAVIFGGGIGEHAPAIRARICDGMEWCGLRLDPRRNAKAVGLGPGEVVPISEPSAPLSCYVAAVDEEIEIACATSALLGKSPGNPKDPKDPKDRED